MSDNPFRRPPHAPPPAPAGEVVPDTSASAANTAQELVPPAAETSAGALPGARELAGQADAVAAATLERTARTVRESLLPGGESLAAGERESAAPANAATAASSGAGELAGQAGAVVAETAQEPARPAHTAAAKGPDARELANTVARESVPPSRNAASSDGSNPAGAVEAEISANLGRAVQRGEVSAAVVESATPSEALSAEPVILPPTVTEVQAGWYNPAEPGKANQPPSQAGWRKAPELVPAPPPFVEPEAPVQLQPAPPPMMGESRSWMALFSGLAWIVLCFELGAFLLVYPWMDGWDQNYFATLQPAWHDVWVNPWIRGAVSGLGTVNILIALIELFRYLRHWLFD